MHQIWANEEKTILPLFLYSFSIYLQITQKIYWYSYNIHVSVKVWWTKALVSKVFNIAVNLYSSSHPPPQKKEWCTCFHLQLNLQPFWQPHRINSRHEIKAPGKVIQNGIQWPSVLSIHPQLDSEGSSGWASIPDVQHACNAQGGQPQSEEYIWLIDSSV